MSRSRFNPRAPARRPSPAPRHVRALAALIACLAACAAPRPKHSASNERPSGPYVLVLGTAQDGGLPQLACQGEACRTAREDPSRARRVVSLLLVDPRTDRRWLFEATPDLPEQVELAQSLGALPRSASGRPALFDGLFLTHAHIGHYAGLVHLGREVYGGAAVPLHASRRLTDFLRTNGPWSLLFDGGHLEARPFEAGATIQLAGDLFVDALAVPHRDEFSDTMAFRIRGPRRSLLFLPDIDKWSRWETFEGGPTRIEDQLAAVDVALLDGTFFANGEIPGRPMESIPHPFIEESLARFAPLAPDVRARVRFIHLNHTNPCADEAGAAAASVRAAGLAIARDGERHEL